MKHLARPACRPARRPPASQSCGFVSTALPCNPSNAPWKKVNIIDCVTHDATTPWGHQKKVVNPIIQKNRVQNAALNGSALVLRYVSGHRVASCLSRSCRQRAEFDEWPPRATYHVHPPPSKLVNTAPQLRTCTERELFCALTDLRQRLPPRHHAAAVAVLAAAALPPPPVAAAAAAAAAAPPPLPAAVTPPPLPLPPSQDDDELNINPPTPCQ